MKPILPKSPQIHTVILLFLVVFMLPFGTITAQEITNNDKTISPFFYVECNNSSA